MLLKRLIPIFVIFWSLVGQVSAQQQAVLSLQAETTNLQTGQEYVITIRLDNAPPMWLVGMEISYDPSLLHVFGEKSGSPVRQGEFFAPTSSLEALDTVQEGSLIYSVSQIPPADLISGSGVVGTFRIYPIAPGATRFVFTRAQILTTTFTGEGAQRSASEMRELPLTPVLLELTITGDPVEPPIEATATLEPTATRTPITGVGQALQEPTLANATSAPNANQTPLTALESSPQAGANSPSALTLALLVTAFAAVGLVVVLLLWRRSRRP